MNKPATSLSQLARLGFISPCLAILTFLLWPQAAFAQLTVTEVFFTPPAPTADDTVYVRIDVMAPSCGFFPTTTVNGTTIRTTITMRGCFLGPPGPIPASVFTQLGPVPAGTYTYEIYSQYEDFNAELVTQRSLTVAPASPSIPTLENSVLAALAIVLSILGLVFIRRH